MFGRLREELKDREREAHELYEQEHARLVQEAQHYGRQFEEKTAANELALKSALATLKSKEADLLRQEAAVQEFLAVVKNQLTHLQIIRDRFKVPGADTSQPASKPNVA